MATEVGYDGEIDFSRPWRRVTLRDAIRDETGLDVLELRDRDALVAAAKEKGIELDPTDVWPQLVDELLSKHVEPKIVNPTFVMDYPKELSPFAKDHRSEPGLVERFECFAGGDGVRERLHRAERPGRAARALRGAGSASPRRATRRRSRSTRTSSRRSSTACRRRAGSAWASTGW